MKSNLHYLVKALGWRSASMQRVALVTGLTIQEIIMLDHAPKRLTAYKAGRKAVNLGIVLETGEAWMDSAARGWRYDLRAYWRGVLDATRENEKT